MSIFDLNLELLHLQRGIRKLEEHNERAAARLEELRPSSGHGSQPTQRTSTSSKQAVATRQAAIDEQQHKVDDLAKRACGGCDSDIARWQLENSKLRKMKTEPMQ